MAVRNGRIPLSSLTAIPWASGRYLRADAAAALTRLNAAFRARFGHDLIINDAYRSYATQVDYRARTRLPRTDPRWLSSASRPGTSQHGWGLAVDLGQVGGFGSTKHRWLTQNAPRFGFYQPAQYQADGAYPEPWHWEYDPDLDQGEDMPLTEADLAQIAHVVRANGVGYANPNLDKRDVLAILRSTNTYAASVSVRLAAQEAQITNLIGAVAALSRGEAFDEAKLRAGIRTDVEAAVKAAVGDALEFDVTFTPRKD